MFHSPNEYIDIVRKMYKAPRILSLNLATFLVYNVSFHFLDFLPFTAKGMYDPISHYPYFKMKKIHSQTHMCTQYSERKENILQK